ncbi:MAG: hypothetical protein K0S33_1468 [Bacteroidetes bacterium]|jgi:hypothetical protein|nr:hypothetical protein [Bacteroidota bacterium]
MNISINKSCKENWDAMTPNEQGAFCSVCTKNVVDFSKKTIGEIKDFFSLPKEGRVCGRFSNEQLTELSFDSFFEKFSGWKLNRKVAIVIVTAFFSWFIGAGTAYAQKNTHKVGKIKVTPPVTQTNPPVKTPKDTTKCVRPPESHTKGEIYVAPQTQPKRKEGER